MSDDWDDYAADWDRNPAVIAYAEKAFRCLGDIADVEGAEVFDFGCGTGLLTEKLSPMATTVVALDTSQGMIDVLAAKNLPNVVPIRGTLSELLASEPARYRSRFDLAVASSVCAFVADYEEVLLQLRALLREGGTFVQWDWVASEESGGTGFTEAQVLAALEKAGFRSVTVAEAFSMPDPESDAAVLMAVACR